jgi:hypothetical protein
MGKEGRKNQDGRKDQDGRTRVDGPTMRVKELNDWEEGGGRKLKRGENKKRERQHTKHTQKKKSQN